VLHEPFDAFAHGVARGDSRLGADRIIQAWQGLERAATLPTQRLAFADALMETMLTGSCVEVFLHESGGVVDALLPLCRDRRYLARWRMLGAQEVFEPNDIICTDSVAAGDLARTIARQARPLSFDRIPAGSPLVPALHEAMRGRGLVSVRPAVPYPVIELDERWCEPESLFNSGRRSDFRRAERRASQFGEVSFEVLSPESRSFDAVFDEAIRVENSGWKNEAGTAIANDRKKESFFRNFFRLANEQGDFRAAFMRIDGRAVAMQLAVEFRQRYWLFKIGYDEEFRRCSPGTLLMLHTLRHAAERKLEAYEFLGNCEPWIADFWTQQRHDCVRIRTYPFNVRGVIAMSADGAAWLGQRLKSKSE